MILNYDETKQIKRKGLKTSNIQQNAGFPLSLKFFFKNGALTFLYPYAALILYKKLAKLMGSRRWTTERPLTDKVY